MEERMINGRRNFVYDVPDGMEIETVALGMLEQNEIKGLLPFRMIQQDAERYFRYDAQRGISLAEWLGKVRTRKEVLELTESILEAGEEAEHYLLETDHLCTQISYLRTEGNSCRMAYIPLTDYREGNLTELVRQIWEQIKYALDEDYTYIFDLLNAFGRKDIRDISELRRWVRMLQNGETSPGMMRPERTMAESEKPVIQPEEPMTSANDGSLGMPPRKKKSDKKHHLFGSGKKQDKKSAVQMAIQPEQEQYIQPVRKKYYNEIEDNEATVLVTSEERGYLIRKSSGQEYLLENSTYVIGSGGQADISIDINSAVSRKHAEIGKDENGFFYIRDLNSTNGTFVGGERLVPGRTHPVGDGARIKLANEEFYFELRRR